MKRFRKIRALKIRVAFQWLLLIVFLFLFRQTDYSGSDSIGYAVNIFFRLDPLHLISTILASKTFIILMLPAIIIIFLTFGFGRFFCGWLCPLGSMLDGVHHLLRPIKTLPSAGRTQIKYALLTIILIAAFFGLPLAGHLDPFSILMRGMSFGVDPILYSSTSFASGWLYRNAPDWITAVSEPTYGFLKDSILPYNQKIFYSAAVSAIVLLLILLAERLERRFWCRNLCPLGALLGVISRFSLLRGHGGTGCGECRICRNICRMGAIDETRQISPEACNLCLDCLEVCPRNQFQFRFSKPENSPAGERLSRRAFISAGLTGFALPLFTRATGASKIFPLISQTDLLRPPGALPEKDFLDLCVRCGECMKVCIGNALHPMFLESGLDASFTPRLIPRIGYCEYHCTLCGQVCPTGAIQKLTVEKKCQFVIGTAYFDKNRCLPFANATPCIVCEEHCPTPDKAIKFIEATVIERTGEEILLKRPYVVPDLCIGCGICETRCPLPGRSAVIITKNLNI